MKDTPILYGETKPDTRLRVYFIVIGHRSSESPKVVTFCASLDLDLVVKRAQEEAKELGYWESRILANEKDPNMPSKDFRWAGDEGEEMWIGSLPLEGDILTQLAAIS